MWKFQLLLRPNLVLRFSCPPRVTLWATIIHHRICPIFFFPLLNCYWSEARPTVSFFSLICFRSCLVPALSYPIITQRVPGRTLILLGYMSTVCKPIVHQLVRSGHVGAVSVLQPRQSHDSEGVSRRLLHLAAVWSSRVPETACFVLSVKVHNPERGSKLISLPARL